MTCDYMLRVLGTFSRHKLDYGEFVRCKVVYNVNKLSPSRSLPVFRAWCPPPGAVPGLVYASNPLHSHHAGTPLGV